MACRELQSLWTACFHVAQKNRLSTEIVGPSMIESIVQCSPRLINRNIFSEPKKHPWNTVDQGQQINAEQKITSVCPVYKGEKQESHIQPVEEQGIQHSIFLHCMQSKNVN